MLFTAAITNRKGRSVSCRIFDASAGAWWTGSTWSETEGDALYYALNEVVLANEYENNFVGEIEPPAGSYYVEYIDDESGVILGSEWTGSPAQIADAVNAKLTASHGAGSWVGGGSGSVPGSATPVGQAIPAIFAGDSKYLEFSVIDQKGAVVSLVGASIKWAMAPVLADSSMGPAIASKATPDGITITAPSAGIFRVALDPADTQTCAAGIYRHEAEITDSHGRKGTLRLVDGKGREQNSIRIKATIIA